MLQICDPGMIFGLRRDGRIHWSMSVWRRFLHPDTVWTHAAWSLRRSQLQSSSFHFCPPSFLLYSFFFFLQCMMERLLYRVADVHWSCTTPMSRTHPMCLLLATLHNRAGPTGRKRGSQKRGEGEKSKEFDMLCAWATCIKQRQSVYVCAWKE